MPASTFLRAAPMAAVASWLLLIGTSSVAAQTSTSPEAGPPGGPPLMSDGVDTTAVQTLTGRSRFSVGQHGPNMDHLPAVRENVELVSKLEMSTPPERRFDPETGLADPTQPPVNPGQIADLAVYKNFAYLNSWSEASCQRGGIFIVDISDPKAPQQVGFLPAAPNTRHGEGAHVITIGAMDVLAVNNEPHDPPCDQTLPSAGGIDLWDVTDPRNPRSLALGIGDSGPEGTLVGTESVHHAHSTFLWKDDTGRAFAVLTDNMEFGTSDIDIFDISDPTAPKPVADFNLRETFPQVEDNGALRRRDVSPRRRGQEGRRHLEDAGVVLGRRVRDARRQRPGESEVHRRHQLRRTRSVDRLGPSRGQRPPGRVLARQPLYPRGGRGLRHAPLHHPDQRRARPTSTSASRSRPRAFRSRSCCPRRAIRSTATRVSSATAVSPPPSRRLRARRRSRSPSAAPATSISRPPTRPPPATRRS